MRKVQAPVRTSGSRWRSPAGEIQIAARIVATIAREVIDSVAREVRANVVQDCATELVCNRAMQILRHAQISVTMEIYAKASSTATQAALKRLGDSLDGPRIEAAE